MREHFFTTEELTSAIFEWIEAWYNSHRRHTALAYLSPVAYERLYRPAETAA